MGRGCYVPASSSPGFSPLDARQEVEYFRLASIPSKKVDNYPPRIFEGEPSFELEPPADFGYREFQKVLEADVFKSCAEPTLTAVPLPWMMLASAVGRTARRSPCSILILQKAGR